MSKGPEANFWNSIRQNLPKKSLATRIENVHGGGIPDVHILWDGKPFWAELKVAKGNAVRISAHQVAFHMAYYARGGLSFFLVKAPSSGHLYSFRGDQGPALAQGGLIAGEGPRFESVRALIEGLGPMIDEHYAGVITKSCGPSRL